MKKPFITCLAARAMSRRSKARGFTLVELSVVLVVLAVITSAVTVGGDLMRNAKTQRLYSDFVFGWSNAFLQYTSFTKVVPGDNLLAPLNVIKGLGGSNALCNDAVPTMTNIFLASGITPPNGRSEGHEDRYVYQDHNGQPHELQACFMTVPWAVTGSASGTYVLATRHVLRLSGLTHELASQLDAMIDNRADARFGKFRLLGLEGRLTAQGQDWTIAPSKNQEDFIPEVSAYLEMS